MRWEWVRSWSPLAVAVVLLGGAAIALERDNVDGAAGLAAVAFTLVGVWIAVQLHDHFKGPGDDG